MHVNLSVILVLFPLQLNAEFFTLYMQWEKWDDNEIETFIRNCASCSTSKPGNKKHVLATLLLVSMLLRLLGLDQLELLVLGNSTHMKLYLTSTCIFLVLFIGVYLNRRIIDIHVCLVILSIHFPINPDEYSFSRHKKVYVHSVKQGVGPQQKWGALHQIQLWFYISLGPSLEWNMFDRDDKLKEGYPWFSELGP